MAISLQANQSTPGGSIAVDGQTVLTFSTTNGVSGTLAPNTVTTTSIRNNSVTPEKLAQTIGTPLSSEGFPVITTDTYVGGFKNRIINGNFDVWQRRTDTQFFNLSTPFDGYRSADRWASSPAISTRTGGPHPSLTNILVATGEQRTLRMSCGPVEHQNFGATFFWRAQFNNVNLLTDWSTNLGVAYSVLGIQNMENVSEILGKPVTVSFWARASQNTKILFEDQVHSAVQTLWTPTINKIFDITTSWRKYTFTYTMPTYDQVLEAGYNPATVNLTANPPVYPLYNSSTIPPLSAWVNQVDLKMCWTKGANLLTWNHPTRPANYPGGNTVLTDADIASLQASHISTGYIDLAQVQFEVGRNPTTFEDRPFATELALCQRYYCKSYSYNIVPGTSAVGYVDGGGESWWDSPQGKGALQSHEFVAVGGGTIHNYSLYTFPVPMRTTPTVTFFHPGWGNRFGNNTIYLGGLSTVNFPVRSAGIVSNTFTLTERSIGAVGVTSSVPDSRDAGVYVLLSSQNGPTGYAGHIATGVHFTAEADF